MSEQNNTQQVQQLYAAFGQGDIVTIMSEIADEVEWVIPGPTDLPWKGLRHGKPAVQEWFGLFAEHIDFQVFEPREFIAQGDKVVVMVHTESTMRRTGRHFVNPEVHVWTFGGNKVTKFQIYEDTATVAAAYRGV